MVWIFIPQVKIVDEGMEVWVRFEYIKSFFLRHMVLAIDKIDKDSSLAWGKVDGQRLCDEDVVLAVSSVGQVVKPTLDGKAIRGANIW
jgi:hypothetical protein